MKEITLQPVEAWDKNHTLANNAHLAQLSCPAAILEEFRKTLKDTPVLGCTVNNPYTGKTETIPENVNDLTARHLQLLARNESSNTSGIMNFKLYQNLLTEDQVVRLRCLVKATINAGVVMVTHSGGFYELPRIPFVQPQKMIIIDQAGLQWQSDFRNTGAMFFYPNNPLDKKLPPNYVQWQEDMFKAMYGKQRPKFPSDISMRGTWIYSRSFGGGEFSAESRLEGSIDKTLLTGAFAVEFRQALDATVAQGALELNQSEKIIFKFLKAGMGFFSRNFFYQREYKVMLETIRLQGIEQALNELLALNRQERNNALGKVACLELPFSNEFANPAIEPILRRIKTATENLGLKWGGAPNEDCFTMREGYVIATTNCGDNHALIGNEGGFSSVDAMISSNGSVGHLNPVWNEAIRLRVSMTPTTLPQTSMTENVIVNWFTNLFSSSSSTAQSLNEIKLIKLINSYTESIKPGDWYNITDSSNGPIEIGIGHMSGNKAIANNVYHIEIINNELTVYKKQRPNYVELEKNQEHYEKIFAELVVQIGEEVFTKKNVLRK